ncbi:hypothetical protein NQ315_014976 [Exocentrus adspersus]|uniref:Chitin-binding type-2 domain-containing protein n=1 Tax=Exocentrus adspersus TaxID=1586481 RepID=A0AAV8VX69_9CUCU|nr:hypothetical protein NQ315_014976 [Exocentrus adspersus]
MASQNKGFSVGDELGFKESISNTEQNRRRAAPASAFEAQLIQAQQKAKKANSLTVRAPQPVVSVEAVPVSSMQVVTPLVAGAVKTSSKKIIFNPTYSQASLMGNSPSNGQVMAVVAVPKTQAQDKISSTNFAVRTLPTPNNDLPAPIPQHSTNSIQAILAANNVTEDELELALLRRQQMLAKLKTTTTTTTTHRPTSKYANSVGKVMNAPKEYYPVGYDKNFDDNFASRVELPETSFYCGDQKHFPGLYADEDLGCMVFHVCALTDDGLIMKSFLCPESTLFDQTILKCNWWFYVDCKNSKKIVRFEHTHFKELSANESSHILFCVQKRQCVYHS